MASSGSFNTGGYEGRYLTFSWSVASQSVVNNQTIISWTLKGAGGSTTSWYNSGNFKVVINGSIVYSSSTRIKLYNGTTVASGQFTIAHNSDGNKTFSASAEAGIYTIAVNCRGNGSWALPQIARQATITNAPNFTDIQNPTITYSNPAGNNVTKLQACISLTGSNDDIAYRDIPSNGTSYTFNLTEAERNVLRKAAANSKTLTVYFYVATFMGGTIYRSNVPKTLTIVNANPAIASYTYKDSNSTTTNITKNNQIIIRNNSNLLITLNTITSLKYATLSSVQVTLNGVTKTASGISGNTSVSSVNVNMGTVNLSQNGTASIVVTDSRGNTTTYSQEITIADWVNPSAIIELHRKNNFYTETDITVDGSISSLNGKNIMKIQYHYKKITDTNYSVLATLQDNVKTTFNIDNSYDWNVRVIISDLIGSTTYNLFVDKGIPLIFFDRLNNSVGINGFPTEEKSLEVFNKIKQNGVSIVDLIYPVGSIYMSVNTANPATLFGGTWEQIKDTFLLSAGDTYKAGATGGEAAHTLTLNEIPKHQHYLTNSNSGGSSSDYSSYGVQATSNVGYGANVSTNYVGGSTSHNNMPPYLTVYVWKRVS